MSPDTPLPCEDRLALAPLGPGRWRNLHGEPNHNGRAYGGHLLGLAMQAALQEAPRERPPTMLQFLFRQGAMVDRPIDLSVARLQDGKRLCSLQVDGAQAERSVFSANVSFALDQAGPVTDLPTTAPPGERPDDLPTFEGTPPAFVDAIDVFGGFGRGCSPALDHRIPDPMGQLHGTPPAAGFRHWLRVPAPLPDDPRLHYAALAYLSDWWLIFCMWLPELRRAQQRRLHVASINHSMWFHGPPRADRWIHVGATCLRTGGGRGLVIGGFHDIEGRHLATAVQECLTTYV